MSYTPVLETTSVISFFSTILLSPILSALSILNDLATMATVINFDGYASTASISTGFEVDKLLIVDLNEPFKKTSPSGVFESRAVGSIIAPSRIEASSA